MARPRALTDLERSGARRGYSFRIVGSVVAVPLAEELAFRGYLTRRLIAADFQDVPLGRLTWLSFLVSSALFGALHGRWLAGILAGMIYAMPCIGAASCRCRRRPRDDQRPDRRVRALDRLLVVVGLTGVLESTTVSPSVFHPSIDRFWWESNQEAWRMVCWDRRSAIARARPGLESVWNLA